VGAVRRVGADQVIRWLLLLRAPRHHIWRKKTLAQSAEQVDRAGYGMDMDMDMADFDGV